MTKKELEMLTDDELREIGKLKNKKGTATNDAKKAQEVLWARFDGPFCCDTCGTSCIAPGTEDQGYWEGVM